MYMTRKGIQFGRKDAYHTMGLAKFIHGWVSNLKFHLQKADDENEVWGVPLQYCGDVSNLQNESGEDYDARMKKASDAYFADLDKIIFAFDVKNAYEYDDETRTKVEEGRRLFAELFPDLWW